MHTDIIIKIYSNNAHKYFNLKQCSVLFLALLFWCTRKKSLESIWPIAEKTEHGWMKNTGLEWKLIPETPKQHVQKVRVV